MKLNIKKDFSKLLRNKWVLHIVSLLSLLTLIGYSMMNNINAVALFIVIAILVFFFSQNMIIVLGVPLILVNLFVSMNVVKEGLENNSSSSSTTASPSTSSSSSSAPSSTTSATPSSTTTTSGGSSSNPNKRTPQGLPTTSIDEGTSLNSSVSASNNTTTPPPPTDESFEVGRAKRGGGYNIDYASTIEDAYDELNKILGGNGIKKLTGDTQNLMKQQLQLAEAMKGMGPLIKGMAPLMQQAQGLLGGLKDGEGLGGIMEMAKKFSPPAV
jgi:hypothetical protein